MRVLWVALAVVLADQATKLAVKLQMYPHESIPVVGRLFRLTFTENPGMAFGLTLGSKLALTLFSIVATIAIAAYLWAVRRGPLGYRLALALILGGAFGNIIDRTFYGAIWGECEPPGTTAHRLLYGCVVDFIHLDVWSGLLPSWLPFVGGEPFALFPIGNIADLAIIAGVAAILVFQKRFAEHMARQEREAAALAAPVGAVDEGAPPAAGG